MYSVAKNGHSASIAYYLTICSVMEGEDRIGDN
jgi:hypothetical protein